MGGSLQAACILVLRGEHLSLKVGRLREEGMASGAGTRAEA